MTPQARTLGIIEILEAFLETSKPADEVLHNYLKTRRYIGSKDRRFITDFFWKIIRNIFKLCWGVNLNPENIKAKDARLIMLSALIILENKKAEDLNSLFDGSKYAPCKLSLSELNCFNNNEKPPPHIKLELPLWLYQKLERSFQENIFCELNALLNEAKPVLRVNTLKTNIENYMTILDDNKIAYQKSNIAPRGIILEKRTKTSDIPYFKEGYVEFQDEASQLAALLSNAKKNDKILDFCAGAGGKSLAIASLMENYGEIIATDISQTRLNNIKERINRAGAAIIKPFCFKDYTEIPAYFQNHFDVVLVDAPCSGTGTFRRSPDAKLRLNEHYLNKLNKTQKIILNKASQMVKNGGTLVYITCSMLICENDDIVNEFIENNQDFHLENANHILLQKTNNNVFDKDDFFLKLTPYQNHTDGFFASVIKKLTYSSPTKNLEPMQNQYIL